MDRRIFLSATAALATLGASASVAQPVQPRLFGAALRRLGATTVCFRKTFGMVAMGANPANSADFLTAPKFLKDNLGLSNIEVWNLQFPEQSEDYCRKFRQQADASGSKVINIQLDGDYDLSSTDGPRRSSSVDWVKAWMDRAVALGAPSVRANIDMGRPNAPLNLETATQSFRQLADYGRSKGVKILVENHIGASTKVDNCVSLLRAVNNPFCRAIVDWGNSSADTEAGRIADLAKLFPFADLVSAKGLHFDANYKHREYAFAPIARAMEAAGYKGIYSVELYAEPDSPADPTAACRAVLAEIAPELKG